MKNYDLLVHYAEVLRDWLKSAFRWGLIRKHEHQDVVPRGREKVSPVVKEYELIHDPLDGSVLREPVALAINHPTGKTILCVNGWNKAVYLEKGPRGFASTARVFDGQMYYIGTGRVTRERSEDFWRF